MGRAPRGAIELRPCLLTPPDGFEAVEVVMGWMRRPGRIMKLGAVGKGWLHGPSQSARAVDGAHGRP